jgi:Na+-transporting methylmalonyl-CoA/oxaloacetate decarboxylase gamma subunit
MLWNILAVSAENAAKGYPKYINIGEASVYALLGFSVVFLGIALLIAIVWAIGRLMAYLKGEPIIKEKKEVKKPVEKAVIEEKVELAPQTQSDEVDEETVAVIMAALMAYYEQNYPKCEFTVKRIKRI